LEDCDIFPEKAHEVYCSVLGLILLRLCVIEILNNEENIPGFPLYRHLRMCSLRHNKLRKDKVTNIENVEVSLLVENDELADNSNYMTSTPIKGKFDCEECHNISQCTDCYVRQLEN
jgi:hypothetical protein